MNTDFGLLFPGQGSQSVGMGADLYDRYPKVRDVYDRAVDVLEFDIRKISFEGPDELLRQTRNTQPAILTHSLAVISLLPETNPVCAAGHSLGEYSALHAAGVLDFPSVLKLVQRRGALMFAAGEKNPGTMAAIIGLDSTAVEQLCSEVQGIVVPANYNEPRQTVISGEIEAVKTAVELAKSRGALKAVLLPVSGAFHSPLLADSAAEFVDYMRQFEFHDPRCPVVANVTGRPVSTADEIRTLLAGQLVSPVRWVETVASAKALGCARFLELGPGQVLAGLGKRIDRDLPVKSVGKVADIESVLAEGI